MSSPPTPARGARVQLRFKGGIVMTGRIEFVVGKVLGASSRLGFLLSFDEPFPLKNAANLLKLRGNVTGWKSDLPEALNVGEFFTSLF